MSAGRWQTRIVVCSVLLLVGGPLVFVGAGAQQPASAGVYQQQFNADSVLIEVQVSENGTARWQIRYRFALETENETAAFTELEQDIEQNRSAFLTDFRTRIQATVADAENLTQRPMSASEFSISTSRQPVSESGFVTYSFVWTNFAVVDGETLRIGDAISGLFLDSQTTLTISWPAQYSLEQVDPEYDRRSGNAVTWDGRRSFGADAPRVVVSQGGDGLLGLAPLVIGGLAILVVLVGGVYLYWQRSAPHPSPISIGEESNTDQGTATTGSGEEATAEPPSELLSNEERVIQLLEANGGRMKQQEVVSELEWTEAKTSQVVNGMREEESLEVFRIGRENVLKLPEEDLDEES